MRQKYNKVAGANGKGNFSDEVVGAQVNRGMLATDGLSKTCKKSPYYVDNYEKRNYILTVWWCRSRKLQSIAHDIKASCVCPRVYNERVLCSWFEIRVNTGPRFMTSV